MERCRGRDQLVGDRVHRGHGETGRMQIRCGDRFVTEEEYRDGGQSAGQRYRAVGRPWIGGRTDKMVGADSGAAIGSIPEPGAWTAGWRGVAMVPEHRSR